MNGVARAAAVGCVLWCLLTASASFADGGGSIDPPLPSRSVFPPDNSWNQRIDELPVDPNSDAIIAHMNPAKGLHPDFGTVWNGAPNGIPYCIVGSNQKRAPVTFDYAGESDPGPYPIPSEAPIEGGPGSNGDRHVLVIDRDNWILYELYDAHPDGAGGWHCGSGAIFNLATNTLRPPGWTSADAAGLPIFPGLVRYDEVVGKGEIDHALRFTAARVRRAYVFPARHLVNHNLDPLLPPLGMRLRLKASVDISRYPPHLQVILLALKRYGMFLADVGSDWFISGAPDNRWNDDKLGELRRIKGSDFEVVKMGPVTTQ